MEVREKYPVDKGHQKASAARMTITRQTVADQVAAYLQHTLSRAQLVDWSERARMEGEFAEQDMDALRTAVARLGVADVRTFKIVA